MRAPTLLLTVLAVLAAAAPVRADQTPRERLAMTMVNAAQRLMNTRLTIPRIQLGTILVGEAATLAPDDPEIWRLVRDLAMLGEREELLETALKEIVRLDPADDVARLQRISVAVDRYGTIEERRAAYKQLLDREHRDRVTPPIASRLALELALLERRHGDVEAFAEALSLAVSLDPSNRRAAAIAAGFFRLNVDDAHGEAELLVDLMLADPTDLNTQLTLARLLLENGAYQGAQRLYSLLIRNQVAWRQRPTDDLIADRAIALWGSGNAAEALAEIQAVQQQRSDAVRDRIRIDDPTLGPLERKRVQASLSPTLATVRATISGFHEEERLGVMVEHALDSYEALLAGAATARPLNPEEEAQAGLERAWVLVWLAGDAARARRALGEVEREAPLSDAVRQRFGGWLALREGRAADAVSLLTDLADTDPAARLGLAEAYLELGRRKEAALTLLMTAREQPGTLLGIWASNRLYQILGQRAQLNDLAARLEELIAVIPSDFDRYPEAPTLALELDVDPAQQSFGPFEPIVINIRIANNSSYPLAIDPNGPIRTNVLLLFSTTLQRLRDSGIPPLQPVVVNIDRRLRLGPHEQLVVPVDLRRYTLGSVLSTRAARGTFVRVKGILNFISFQPPPKPDGSMRAEVFEPGPLGSEEKTEAFRVEGEDVTVGWLAEAATFIADPANLRELRRIGLLAQVGGYDLPEDAAPELFKVVSDARQAVISAFTQMDGVSQAWLLSVVHPDKLFPQLRGLAQRSNDRLVRMAYLMFHAIEADDPMIDAGRRSGDQNLAVVAYAAPSIANWLANRKPAAAGSGGRP